VTTRARDRVEGDCAHDPLALLDGVVAGLGGEHRGGQRELTEAVADALASPHHLLAQAPTGAGKSFAYLVPIVASGLRVVVATATIALQDQLVGKDLPDVARFAGIPCTYARLKGRSNYVCRAKLHAAQRPDALFEERLAAGYERELAAIAEFAEADPSGDRSDLTVDVADATWRVASCGADECPGRARCAQGAQCFAELARERASDVQVLVVNHSLYCMHLEAGGNLLPEHDAVVIDEAHAFAARATAAFGAELTPSGLEVLARQLSRVGTPADKVRSVERSARALSGVVDARDGRVAPAHDTELVDALTAVAERLNDARTQVKDDPSDAAARVVQLVDARVRALRKLATPDPDDVVWVEGGRSRRLCVAPVSVGARLARTLFAHQPVIGVSATLGGPPPFAAIATALGLDPNAASDEVGPGYASLAVESPFDWRAQGLLYVAKDLAAPRRDEQAWLTGASERLLKLVTAAGGRSLVLCTSLAKVRHFSALLREHTGFTVLMQGDAANARLAERFREDEHSVLVGTRTFFEGLDVPGSACVLVVIDRLPFTTPADPLASARKERIAAGGGDPFTSVDLPEAALVLAQGAGRLIRRRGDRGVVAVLDSRLATMRYRAALLAALPPLKRTIDLDEVCTFLAGASTPA
jgi:ATP-dependent DNA helicase DinG